MCLPMPPSWPEVLKYFFFKILFIFRGEGREKWREALMCGCLSRVPYWGPGLQPRPVP